MRRFTKLLSRFYHNEDGVFAVFFGLVAVALVALSGAAVDYVTLEQARNRAQIAIDSAALALQPRIYTSDTEEQIRLKADAWLAQRISDPRITATVQSASANTDTGSLILKARLTVPTTFVALIGFTEFTPTLVSEATRQKLFVELALVLDNSGSMSSSSRMTNLKIASKSATDILFDNQDTSVNAFIGIVPFNFWVNIGPNSKNKSWMDTTGISSASHDGFDDDDNDSNDFTGPLNRFDIYDEMDGESWEGCVEARPQPYDANDAVPTTSVPDTLFVPALSPDQPDEDNDEDEDRDYPGDYLDDNPAACQVVRACRIVHVDRNCTNSSGSNCSGSPVDRQRATYSSGIVINTELDPDDEDAACSCDGEVLTSGPTTTATLRGNGNYNVRTVSHCTDYYSDVSSLSHLELQERMCKYTSSSPADRGRNGPNADCITTQVLPLSNSRTAVKARIDSMTSSGATNIHQGAIWGFHMLSPTEPYTEGRGYEEATSKVMIIMTDGQNTFYSYNDDTDDLNGASYYPPYGWPRYNRLGNNPSSPDANRSDGQMEDLVDGRLLETCENIKDAGIIVYTVGLSSPESVKSMLRSCASGTDYAKFPTESSELVSVFEGIAGQLADLRIAQ